MNLRTLCLLGLLLGLALPGAAQTPVKNPSALAFQCPDHDRDDQHEIDLVRVSDGAVIQTILGGDPPLDNGEVVIAVNIQPVAFGQYRFVVRAVAGGFSSPSSLPSAVWERVPGQPSPPEPR